jgi:acyl-CoA synthetase (AMP-forming)/AMP-acid ligase II
MKSGTVIDALEAHVVESPGAWAFTFLQGTSKSSITYREVYNRAARVAVLLQERSFPGDRALLLCRPGLEFITAFFGCLLAGVVAVPAYPPHPSRPRHSAERLRLVVADCAASVVITTSNVREQLRETFEAIGAAPDLEWLDIETCSRIDPRDVRNSRPSADDVAFLQYTSGSTSNPKGVIVRHSNISHNAKVLRELFPTGSAPVVTWLPTYHDMGLLGTMIGPIYRGAPVVMMAPAAFLQRPLLWLEAISTYKAGFCGAPNFAYDLCVDKIREEQRVGLDLSSWQVAFNGAEPVRADTLERFTRAYAAYGFRAETFYPCYGLAESTLAVTGAKERSNRASLVFADRDALRLGEVVKSDDTARAQSLVSVGRPHPDNLVVIVCPETLREVSAGRVGEIWVSSESVAGGYWGRAEQSESTFGVGLSSHPNRRFLRTGDLGFIDAGELFVTGRIKDLIIVNGQNHYPQDIESTICAAFDELGPARCAVFTANDDTPVAIAAACEVTRDGLRMLRRARDGGEDTLNAVLERIRARVSEAHDLALASVLLIQPGALPRTSSGKIQRHKCRDLLLSCQDGLWESAWMNRDDQ